MIEFILKSYNKSLIRILKMKKERDVRDCVLDVWFVTEHPTKRKSLKSLYIGSSGVERATRLGVIVFVFIITDVYTCVEYECCGVVHCPAGWAAQYGKCCSDWSKLHWKLSNTVWGHREWLGTDRADGHVISVNGNHCGACRGKRSQKKRRQEREKVKKSDKWRKESSWAMCQMKGGKEEKTDAQSQNRTKATNERDSEEWQWHAKKIWDSTMCLTQSHTRCNTNVVASAWLT